MYKVHFRLKDTEYELVAKSLDLSHPYFVSIKEFDLRYEEGLVVNPHLENTRKRFENTSNIMIPLQNVSLIESVPERKKQADSTVKVLNLAKDETESGPFSSEEE